MANPTPAQVAKVLSTIPNMTDAAKLRSLRTNALRLKQIEVADAAFRRLCEVQPEEKFGTVEHDFWQTIFAFEEFRSEERGRITQLSRTRQKVRRVGVRQTLIDFATSKAPTSGFDMLIERGLPEWTGEAIIIKHAADFDDHVVAAAKARLAAVAAGSTETPVEKEV